MARLIHAVVILGTCLSVSGAGENRGRIIFDARINGRPVRLAFDTGAEGPILLRPTAEWLKLEMAEPRSDVQPVPGKVRIAITEECELELGGGTHRLRFAVVDLPGFLQPGIDGFIGWGGIKDSVVEISFAPNKISIPDALRIDSSKWSCYELRSDLNVLVMQIPRKDGGNAQVLIDTGSPGGVSLNSERWRPSVRPNQPSTLSASYYPGKGLLVIKEMWAKEVAVEGLTFTEVPVSQGVEAGTGAIDGELDGILGLQALSCFSWVIDGPAGKIYVKPNDVTRVPEKYDYNRLGAVFVPRDIRTTNDLLAHVVEPSPAYDARIRDGDILLKIDGVDATKWRTDPSVMPLSRFWEQPAGTELKLELKRAGQKQNLTVTLQEIFKDQQGS